MPEQVETPEVPPIPDWVSWDDTQTVEYASENAPTCNHCESIQLVREIRPSNLPSNIRNNPELSAHDWVHVVGDRGAGRDGDVPLLRWEHLDGADFTVSSECDTYFEYLDGGTSYDYLCGNCYDELNDSNNEAQSDYEAEYNDRTEYVHDYGYRPRTSFFNVIDNRVESMRFAVLSEVGRKGVLSPASYNGDTHVQEPYFGFELEMTRQSSGFTVDDAARYLHDRTENFAYMKWDGSVDHGFELVTHPHTLEAYNARTELWDALDFLRSRGWRSWNSDSSCGLHIHINNASFSSVGHAMRFLMFVYKNREPLVRFAGRDSHYARFDFNQFVQREVHVGWNDDGSAKFAVGTVADVVKKKQVNDSRYLAVNCQNTHTYELRFFRGNMNPNAVRACLEFVAALHEYTEHLTSHDCLVNRALTWRPFLAFVRRKSAEDNFRYRRLYDRLTLSRRNGDNGFINTSGAE